ncbi:MAG: SDR family NAD(P)-dependent oxidoreductase [Paracoccaceae bacterium]
MAGDAVALAVTSFGKLTGLVNNAHTSRQKPLRGHTEADWALSFDTGCTGTLHFIVADHELKKAGGSIVNFCSGAALDGQPNRASYAAAKEAVLGLSRVAANEWAPDGIRVNLICPLALTEGGRLERNPPRPVSRGCGENSPGPVW